MRKSGWAQHLFTGTLAKFSFSPIYIRNHLGFVKLTFTFKVSLACFFLISLGNNLQGALTKNHKSSASYVGSLMMSSSHNIHSPHPKTLYHHV
jgi:hypothetical protein